MKNNEEIDTQAKKTFCLRSGDVFVCVGVCRFHFFNRRVFKNRRAFKYSHKKRVYTMPATFRTNASKTRLFTT